MNILLPVYQIQDYGGITTQVEVMAMALQEQGHTVAIVGLRPSKITSYFKRPTKADKAFDSVFGPPVMVHLLNGWSGIPVFGYGVREGVDEFKRMANSFDQVIWVLPCPYKDQHLWRELYNLDVPQVADIHDAHYPRAYRHLDDVAHKLEFVAPVNEAAHGALIAGEYPGHIRPINNGIIMHPMPTQLSSRSREAFAAHVWKRWKRMDRLVAAAPHLQDTTLVLGGDGIERRYMASKDKCKPEYVGLWDAFLDSPVANYAGMLDPAEMLFCYQRARLHIDLSSAKFSMYGAHYNRSIMEAAALGCPSLVSENNMQGSIFFQEGETHWEVSDAATPEGLAYEIDWYTDIKQVPQGMRIVANMRQLISEHWDYHKCAKEHLRL